MIYGSAQRIARSLCARQQLNRSGRGGAYSSVDLVVAFIAPVPSGPEFLQFGKPTLDQRLEIGADALEFGFSTAPPVRSQQGSYP
jgi:hypothetical protein